MFICFKPRPFIPAGVESNVLKRFYFFNSRILTHPCDPRRRIRLAEAILRRMLDAPAPAETYGVRRQTQCDAALNFVIV